MPPSRCLVDTLEGEVTCWIKGVGSQRVMAMEVAEVEVMAREAGGHTLLGHVPAGLRQGLATSHIPAPLQGQAGGTGHRAKEPWGASWPPNSPEPAVGWCRLCASPPQS